MSDEPAAAVASCEARVDGSRSRRGAVADGRMAWLDALRAIAVLLVVYAHLSRVLFRGARAYSSEWLHAGPAGVMLFFLVSGYIIPASLERHGSLRAFWVSRVCRLGPLYTVVIVVVLGLGVAGLLPLDPYILAHPGVAAVAHATMLPYLLGVPLVTPVLWTLTFEMAFYLLVSALFAVRLHRTNGVVAVALAGIAVGTVPVSPKLLSGTAAAAGRTTVVVAVVLVLGMAALVSGRRWAVVLGGLSLAGIAGALLTVNLDPPHVWDGLLIVAVMFVGTTIYRADRGQTGWWRPALAGGVVAIALLNNWFAELRSLGALTPRYEARAVITLLTISGAFALAMLTRRRRTPRLLAGLGVISYSIYLVHYVLIQLLRPVLTGLADRLPAIGEAPVVAACLALIFGVSWLTHRYVELPGQRLGRRWTRWLTARYGTAALTAGQGEGPAHPDHYQETRREQKPIGIAEH